ncbi:MAG: sodium-translocating pyrophosphatase, partial [Thaumarchaeota archaeon]|nr:sodium-translocating pyrophosphatase [Nitrososphaerota archaeon]
MTGIEYTILLSWLFALVAIVLLVKYITSKKILDSKVKEIGGFIKAAGLAYIKRQSLYVLAVSFVFFVAIFFLSGIQTSITFIVGSFLSTLAAMLSLRIAVETNSKVTEEVKKSEKSAFNLALLGGSITGLSVLSLSLMGLQLFYAFFKDPNSLVGFGFGASLAAIISQIGGGIFTKGADIGADLVGKTELKLPEDDPRNPAVIADLVGDNVGDCAGRGTDLFQSISSDIITGMLVGLAFTIKYGNEALLIPFLLQAIGLIGSVLGIITIIALKRSSPMVTFNLAILVASVFDSLAMLIIFTNVVKDITLFYSGISGIIITALVGYVLQYYTRTEGRPIEDISSSARRGAAITILSAFSYGLESPIAPVVMVAIAVVFSFYISGSIYGVMIANIGTDMLSALLLSMDSFGPIIDNASGIAEMSNAGHEVRKALERFDAIGNTMKAYTKAFAITSATVSGVLLFITYYELAEIAKVRVLTPLMFVSALLGVSLPFLFSSIALRSTKKTAYVMVDEVRRQVKSNPKILTGESTPDYAKCVDISTKHALNEMLLPTLLSILLTSLVGFVFGKEYLGTFVLGAITSAA